uniref:Uncharacterized protein n=1 Tax=Scophthalmus maximus TaxID=52904 RepID=A0A8D3CHB9_SCOMX
IDLTTEREKEVLRGRTNASASKRIPVTKCHFADALRRSGSLCDAIISVKSHTFRAHRLVLACASRRLAQQLAQGDPDFPAHCTLEYFSPRTFQQVLDFTYTQALEVSVEDLYLLLRAAQLLEMPPLEDQCRKQLDTLDHRAREEEESGEVKHVKEEKESAMETVQKKKGSPVQEEKLQETSSSGRKASGSIVRENLSAKNHSSSPATRKKPRLSPLSPAPYNADSVLTRPAVSSSSSSSPWTFSANMWSSVNTLRQIAENYSNFFGSCTTAASRKQFLLLRYHQVPKGMGVFKDGKYDRKGNNCNGVFFCFVVFLNSRVSLPTSVFTPSPVLSHLVRCTGEACAGCRLCGRGDVVQREPPSNQQDHRRDKPYQCQHCPKKFSLKHQLDTHHRVHTGEKPFECRLCGQRSRDYSAMIKHLRTHGGAAPYQCTVCLEFCSSLVAMQRHVKSHATQDFPPDWSINSTYLYTSHI